MIETKLQPQEIAEKIAKKELDITKMQWHDDFDIQLALKDITHATVERIKDYEIGRASCRERV